MSFEVHVITLESPSHIIGSVPCYFACDINSTYCSNTIQLYSCNCVQSVKLAKLSYPVTVQKHFLTVLNQNVFPTLTLCVDISNYFKNMKFKIILCNIKIINLTDSCIRCTEYSVCQLMNSDTGDDSREYYNKGNFVQCCSK